MITLEIGEPNKNEMRGNEGKNRIKIHHTSKYNTRTVTVAVHFGWNKFKYYLVLGLSN